MVDDLQISSVSKVHMLLDTSAIPPVTRNVSVSFLFISFGIIKEFFINVLIIL